MDSQPTKRVEIYLVGLVDDAADQRKKAGEDQGSCFDVAGGGWFFV